MRAVAGIVLCVLLSLTARSDAADGAAAGAQPADPQAAVQALAAKLAKFELALKDAKNAQKFRENVTQVVESDLIDEAPKVALANGDGDVATNGEMMRGTQTPNQQVSDCLFCLESPQ